MEAHPCLMRFLTNLARLCASKSANGPRKNSFLPDSPLTTTSNRGRKTQPVPLPTPDIARSGRVLRASVKSPYRKKVPATPSGNLFSIIMG